MKKNKVCKNIFILIASFCAVVITAQSMNATSRKDSLRYCDASRFEILGKVYQDSLPVYARIPQFKRDSVRKALWNLGQNSAGLAIRFRSNSPVIGTKWVAKFDNSMNHMTATGIKGLDLYCIHDGKWRFVKSGRPTGKSNCSVLIDNMTAEEREYMLYLPLYDGIDSLEIGIDSASFIAHPVVKSPYREHPLVFYGSSIMQGGCASRPGMASSNIIGRRLDREIINLGFSGNAFVDLEVARIMADIDASVYVLDFVPNASPEQIRERMVEFATILRNAHSDVPIIFIEDPDFTYSIFDSEMRREIADKNAALNEMYKLLKKRGMKHIYLIRGNKLMSADGESTVDGIHSTDLGFTQYVDAVLPVIKKVIKK